MFISLETPIAVEATRLEGYTLEPSFSQLAIEERFASSLSPQSSRNHHRILTEEPHMAGQPSQRKVADYVLDQFRRSGIGAEVTEYHAYLPYPTKVSVKLPEPEKRVFELREKGYSGDKDSFSQEVVIPFNAYSPSGRVEGQVNYVNYGLPEDYTKLEERSTEISGKIVLARYGRSFRGVKAKLAEEQGAAALLLYSDPMEEGIFRVTSIRKVLFTLPPRSSGAVFNIFLSIREILLPLVVRPTDRQSALLSTG